MEYLPQAGIAGLRESDRAGIRGSMCSIIILRRPGHAWPLIIAANRDEMLDRPWDPPGRHWDDRPEVVAGRDRLAGGSWLGRNDHGVFAAILNREGSLGPSADKRSRGELVLEALDHADAADAAAALCGLDPHAYRSFNLVVGDNAHVFHVANRALAHAITAEEIPPGLSMLTSQEVNDRRNARIAAYLAQFEAAAAPDPDTGDWSAWRAVLSDGTYDPAIGPSAAMCIESDWGFGTVSSTLLALPAPGAEDPRGIYLFAPGRPDTAEYLPV
jgi:uncharacterized protein with NRDE domain